MVPAGLNEAAVAAAPPVGAVGGESDIEENDRAGDAGGSGVNRRGKRAAAAAAAQPVGAVDGERGVEENGRAGNAGGRGGDN